MHKIGIVLPTYNRRKLLLRAIKSLQNQIYKDWEVYIVDDCSVENIFEYLIQENIFSDKRIHYKKLNKNQGVNKARNVALEQILANESINYVSLLDDDDYFLEDYFINAVKILEKRRIGWLVTACIREDKRNITIIEKEGYLSYLDYLAGYTLHNDATMMIEKKLLCDIRFTTKYRNGYEWYFFLQLSVKESMFVRNIPSKVVTYLEDGLSLTKRKRDKDKKSFQHESFVECGYNYYTFLAKKNEKKHKIKSYLYKILSLLVKK